MLSSSLRLYYALAPCARRRSAALLLEPPPLHHDAALLDPEACESRLVWRAASPTQLRRYTSVDDCVTTQPLNK